MKSFFAFVLTFTIATGTFAREILYCAGTVRYPSGDPAAGVLVAFYPAHYPGAGDYTEVKTDKYGNFAIINEEEEIQSGFARADIGFTSLTNNILARDIEKNLAAIRGFDRTTTNVNLVLEPAITLSGSFKNTQNKPVSDVKLKISIRCLNAWLGGESEPEVSGITNGSGVVSFKARLTGPEATWVVMPLNLGTIKTDKMGSFSVPALPQGHGYWIHPVETEGYRSDVGEIKEGQTFTNKFVFPPTVLKRAELEIAGRVLESHGKPISGAEVALVMEGQPQDLKTKTDKDGKFFFDDICEGEARIHAFLPGSSHDSNGSSGTIVQAGDRDVVIRLDAPNN